MFIDEKGKLFGKVNIIDLAVIVIIIFVACFGGYKYYQGRKPGTSVLPDKKTAYFTVVCRLVPESCATNIKVGDKLVAKNTWADGTVESVTYTDGDYVSFASDGHAVLTKHPIWKDVTVVLKTELNPNDPIVRVGGQEARIGMRLFVKTQMVEMSGTVDAISIE